MWYDIFSVAVILFLAWKGAARGAIWQLAVLASIGLCILLAGHLTPEIEPYLPLQQPLRYWIAVGLVYLAMSLVTFLAARVLRAWVEKVAFVEYDRHWGTILGVTKGVTLMLVLTSLLVLRVPETQDTLRNSYTGKATRLVVVYAGQLLPANVATGLRRALDDSALPEPYPVRSALEPMELNL